MGIVRARDSFIRFHLLAIIISYVYRACLYVTRCKPMLVMLRRKSTQYIMEDGLRPHHTYRRA